MKINTMEKTALIYRLRIDVVGEHSYLTVELVDKRAGFASYPTETVR